MPYRFEGRLALVTGASRGIGAAIAEAFAAEGAHVVLTARTGADLEEVEGRIHEAGGTATIAPLDLTENESIAKLGIAIAERWEKLDLLVLNAAMLGTLSPVPHIEAKELSKLFTLNLLAQQAMIATFDPMLRRSDAARVLAVTSSVGAHPRPFWSAYGASKAALDTMLLSYAEEMRNIGNFKVAIVDPGATATAMRARAFPGEDPATLKPPSAVAEAVVELAKSDFETGHRLEVRG
jgi:NAD(P)-dependent dehydrogenase (short-subunit alcohol dehydrogenase family)